MLHFATKDQEQQILGRLNTDHQKLKEDVHAVKSWLKMQPHLPQCTSDTMIAAFLIGCRSNIENAKQKIENYYTIRSKMPNLYGNRDPLHDKVKESAEAMLVSPLPKLTPDGCRVTMAAFKIPDPHRYDVTAFTKRLLSIADIRLNNEVFTSGDYLILDGSQFTFAHALRLSPTFAKQLVNCSQDALPIRVKGVIYINSSPIVQATVNIVKPFIKSKLLNRIILYSDQKSLLNHFPKEMLPKEYGGDETSLENLSESWMKRLESERNWLLGDGSRTVNEEKRQKARKTTSTPEKINGNFKQLQID